MKKILSFLIAGVLFTVACNKGGDITANDQQDIQPTINQRNCGSMEVLQQQLAADPTLQKRMDDIENFTQKVLANPAAFKLVNGVMQIPVVVNVLYRTSQENISDAQIASQIAVLNEDYGGTNADMAGVPSIFTTVEAKDTKIRFVLAKTFRKKTTKKSWSTNDAVKKTKMGGLDPTSPTTNLNIWVCTLGNGLLGYAQFPGGNPATDGVVILNSAFGSRALCPNGYFINTYDLGRTATHEIGHWFNLRHIWGDTNCGDDLVNDTPVHTGANYGCPAYPANSTCGGTTHAMMTMNYMDYTDDACMYMFSAGQAARMQATFEPGGPRATY